MRYAAKIAIRHLLSSPGQTVLLITGVGLGVTVFSFMSALIGAIGAVAGALLAFAALAPFPPVSQVVPGQLPIDRGQGQFLLAVLLTTLAASLASLLPARRAAGIDPVEAIGQ